MWEIRFGNFHNLVIKKTKKTILKFLRELKWSKQFLEIKRESRSRANLEISARLAQIRSLAASRREYEPRSLRAFCSMRNTWMNYETNTENIKGMIKKTKKPKNISPRLADSNSVSVSLSNPNVPSRPLNYVYTDGNSPILLWHILHRNYFVSRTVNARCAGDGGKPAGRNEIFITQKL